jgi:uridine kinase
VSAATSRPTAPFLADQQDTKILILLAGPSASGKSSLARKLAAILHLKHLCLDDYYISGKKCFIDTPRGALRTYDRPELYDFARLCTDITAASSGVVVEGFILFCSPQILALPATRYYLDVPFDVCLARRLARKPHRPSDRIFQVIGEQENASFVMPQRDLPGVTVLDGMQATDSLLPFVLSSISARAA